MEGFLIRQKRLAQNLSQESLCRGICAISYLSKIEAGLAKPSDEIIDKLFLALGICYFRDEAKIRAFRQLFFAYFDQRFHQEPIQEIAKKIEEGSHHLPFSPLSLLFQLFASINR